MELRPAGHPPVPDAGAVRALTVVVPAHDEETALPSCLAALERALVEAAHRRPHVRLDAVVVLDTCTDGSAAVVRSFAAAARHRGAFGLHSVEVAAGNVGGARLAGFETALADWVSAGVPLHAAWVASTDADTVVPPHWLTTQLERADAGVSLLVGTVEPDASLGVLERALWLERHLLAEDHPHVHGANLGVRASAYRAVGGFAPLAQHEDVDLVARLRQTRDVLVEATDTTRVVTSSRLTGRAVGGFATYLADLGNGVT